MNNFILIYFNGCPNYEPAKDLLNQVGIKYKQICQDEIADSDPYKEYSSPTFLINDQVIFGSKVSGTGGGCSLKLPSKIELFASIKSG